MIIFEPKLKLISYFQKNGIASPDNYHTVGKILRWSSNDSSISPEKLFDEITQSVTDIVSQIDIRMFKQNNEGSDAVTITNINGLDWKEQRHRRFGKCYTFRPDKEIRDRGIYYIKFEL